MSGAERETEAREVKACTQGHPAGKGLDSGSVSVLWDRRKCREGNRKEKERWQGEPQTDRWTERYTDPVIGYTLPS